MLEIVIDEAAREDVAASLDEAVPHIPRMSPQAGPAELDCQLGKLDEMATERTRPPGSGQAQICLQA